MALYVPALGQLRTASNSPSRPGAPQGLYSGPRDDGEGDADGVLPSRALLVYSKEFIGDIVTALRAEKSEAYQLLNEGGDDAIWAHWQIAMTSQFGLSRRRLMASTISRLCFHDRRIIGLRARSYLSS